LNLINDIQNTIQINNVSASSGQGTNGVVAMFTGLQNNLVDSSIYMSNGNVGIGITTPNYLFQVNGSTFFNTVAIGNSIVDVNNNTILSTGTSLQIGSTSNTIPLYLYTGSGTPAIIIDSCNNVTISTPLLNYIINVSLGPQFFWGVGGYLYVNAS